MFLTKCTGTDCTRKETCHRYTDQTYPNGDYFDTHPLHEEDGKLICREFIPNDRRHPFYNKDMHGYSPE